MRPLGERALAAVLTCLALLTGLFAAVPATAGAAPAGPPHPPASTGANTASQAGPPRRNQAPAGRTTHPTGALTDRGKVNDTRPAPPAPGHAAPMPIGGGGTGWTPQDLWSAYALPATQLGKGKVVGIVDAWDNPNVESDLAAYRSNFNLGPCTTANGCFRKVAQDGSANYPAAAPTTGSWAPEIALDVEMVSATCPLCKIVLVEANSDSTTDLVAAVDQAVAQGAQAVNMSWGSTEWSGETGFDFHFQHPGVAFVASSGDYGYGYGNSWPAASSTVFAVGGTDLFQDATGAWYETAWAGSTSGCSPYEPKPSWQTDTGCAHRTVADISADGGTSLALYSTYPANGWGSGWQGAGGTSASAPMVAGILMLPKNAQDMSQGPSVWYSTAYTPGAFSVYDVTSGSSGTCGGSYLCTSYTGYDGPTGLGTPQGPPPFGGARAPSDSYGGYNKGLTGPPPCTQGDPVVCATGDLFETHSDLSIPGRGRSLDFSRTYNSQDAATATAPGPLGWGWTDSDNMSLTTDGSGNVTVHQEDGATVTFAPSASGYVAPGWVVATLTQNADGTFTYALPNLETDTFSAAGKLLSESDRNGYVTSLAYDGSGRLAAVTDPAGRALTLAYNAAGLVSSVADGAGRSVQYGYDASNNLTSVTDPAGNVTRYGYDGSHRLTTMTRPKGGVTTNVYDASNRVTSQTDALNHATTFAYANGQTTITDPLGHVTVQQYNSYGWLISVTKGSGTADATTTTYAYNAFTGQRISATDGNGHTWRTTWDAQGNETSSTDPLGNAITAAYDGFNDLVSLTDQLGVTTTLAYDAHHNVTSMSTPVGAQTASTTEAYDPAHPGDLVSKTDALGHAWAFAYDAFGNQTSATDPDGHATLMGYDAAGRNTTKTTPRGDTTTTAFDPDGHVLSVTDPLGHALTSTYDADGNQVTVTDGNGRTTTVAYDLADRATSTLRADGTVVQTGYDGVGDVTSQTDGAGHATTYSYDNVGRLAGSVDPLNRAVSYGYDLGGNRVRMVDQAGQTTALAYDAANRLQSVTYTGANPPNASFTYDAAGERATMTDETGTTRYTYDALHRLTDVIDGAGNHVGYGFDLAGRPTTLTYPSGSRVTRTFDPAGRMTGVTDWLGHAFAFGYDADGNLTSTTRPNGTSATTAYDADGRPTHTTDVGPQSSVVLDLPYAYDGEGQLTSANPLSGPSTATQSYGYDANERLTSASVPAGTVGVPTNGYAYDSADNLSRITTAGVDTLLAHDAADQLTSATSSAGTVSYTNDSRGNRTGWTDSLGNTATYSYDAANHLTGSTGPAVTKVDTVSPVTTQVGYAYNGDGLRTQKRVYVNNGWVGVNEVWDVSGTIPLMLSDGVNSFVYGPGGVALEQVAGTTLFLHTDRLGTVRAATNQLGTVVGTFTFDPYGKPLATTGTATTPLGFAGQYTDAETGLIYLRARYYDPTTGSFITRDPLAAASRSPYGYAGDSPVNAVDPLGLFCWSPSCLIKDIGIGLAVVGTAALAVTLLPEITVGATLLAVEEGTALMVTEAGEIIAVDTLEMTAVDIEVNITELADTIAESVDAVSKIWGGVEALNKCMESGFSSGECAQAILEYGVDLILDGAIDESGSKVLDFLNHLRELHNELNDREGGKPC